MRDLAALPKTSGMNGLPQLLYQWLHDHEWVTTACGMPSVERRAWLAEAGGTAFDQDWGGYASCLRKVARSLDHIGSVAEREAILREHMQLLLVNLSDTLDFRAGSNETHFENVSIQGEEHVRNALAAGRGMLALSVHQSHPGFGFLHPAWEGIGISTVANLGDRDAPHASLLLDGLRERVELLPTTAAALRPMLARLASGGCVAIYADFLYPGTPGTPSALLGGPVLVASAAVSLALRTGAAVIPVSVARGGSAADAPVRVRFGAPLPLDRLDARDPASRDIVALTFGLAMEGMIRRAPATWRLWASLGYRWRVAQAQIGRA